MTYTGWREEQLPCHGLTVHMGRCGFIAGMLFSNTVPKLDSGTLLSTNHLA